jgi:hypothetical protein
MQPDRQVQRILCERYPYGQAGGCFVGFGSHPALPLASGGRLLSDVKLKQQVQEPTLGLEGRLAPPTHGNRWRCLCLEKPAAGRGQAGLLRSSYGTLYSAIRNTARVRTLSGCLSSSKIVK